VRKGKRIQNLVTHIVVRSSLRAVASCAIFSTTYCCLAEL